MNRKRHYMSYSVYFIKHLIYSFWICIYYYSLLYIGLPDITANTSKVIFFVCTQFIWLVLSVMTPDKRRSESTAFFNAVLSYLPYFLITYYNAYKGIITKLAVVVTVLSLAYFAIVLLQKVKNKRKLKSILKKRAEFAFNGVRAIAGSFVCAFLAVLCISNVFGINLIKSDAPVLESANLEEAEEWTVANNKDTVLLLQQEKWGKLSFEEKSEVLGVLKNIEQRYLGIPHEVYLAFKPMSENLLGYYSHKEHTITLNYDYVETATAKSILATLCHEIYHAYEHNQIEAYKSVDSKYQKMLMFVPAMVYEDEFNNYVSADENVLAYLSQQSELMADKYAESSVEDYYNRINEYLTVDKASNNDKEGKSNVTT